MDRREFSKKALVGIGALASCSAGAFAKEVLSSKGTKAYRQLAEEFLKKNPQRGSAAGKE